MDMESQTKNQGIRESEDLRACRSVKIESMKEWSFVDFTGRGAV